MGCRCKHEVQVLAEVSGILEGFMGATAAQAFYSYLARNFSVNRRENIHRKPESFFNGLTSLFGEGGRAVARILFLRLKDKIPPRECKFVQALRRASRGRGR